MNAKTPRRESKDLSFLVKSSSSNTNNTNTYLYESQISVLVSAIDKGTYVGYCCVDGYYDTDSEHTTAQAVDSDGDDNDDSDDLGALDPFIRLKQPADPPITDAREYFLLVVDTQVKHIQSEMENTVSFVKRQIDRRVSCAFPRM